MSCIFWCASWPSVWRRPNFLQYSFWMSRKQSSLPKISKPRTIWPRIRKVGPVIKEKDNQSWDDTDVESTALRLQRSCYNHVYDVAAAAKSLQSCPTLCDPIDSSPPGSPVPGILQARTLEWVAISFSNAWKWKVKVKALSHVRLLVTPWTAAYQAPLSMRFSRQEYWSGVP